ncbi:MAG: peptide chain release factor 1 [Candidatus Diapherotrites archaeon]|uniref:Peptide chain release factor subunit 1 n=1 Tax=Candidatus Iainarchaeum sp. TaxID=3101447 RepID=A0A2D6M1B6_9ARCH|nr:peptide chain release factor 1 [Candidatus Diapherotrites archaeon]
MKESHLEHVDATEVVLFKKKLKKLKQYKGRGTELISLYLPPNVDRSSVMGQITEETSQSSNIKSPQTRKNVQGALRRLDNFLKRINFKLPPKGLVVFSGNTSQQEGKSDIRLFTLKPPKELKTKLYWCDSEFHLAPLEEMVAPTDIFGILTIDKKEATIAILIGKKYEILGHFTSGVSGKHRAGGQSAQRFERLHEDAVRDFYRRIAQKMNEMFLHYDDKLKGLLIAGPGITKNYFLNQDLVDHRLKNKILGTIDTSYTDESGIREAVNKSDEILKDAEITKERTTVNNFMGEVVKPGGLAAYGQQEVEEALEMGKVQVLLLSEEIEWMVYKFICNNCDTAEEIVVKDPGKFDFNNYKCKSCKSGAELLEEVDYSDWMIEKAQDTGAETKIISTDTGEGEQFHRGFGGIGAVLRYR